MEWNLQMVMDKSQQNRSEQADTHQPSSGEFSKWEDSHHELPTGERYLYQLFSLIEVGDLTVTNPTGKVFHFGQVGSDIPLHLILHNSDTCDRLLAFGTLGFCEAYMDGWWDEANNNLAELIGLFHRSNVYAQARKRITIPLALKIITQRLKTVPTLIQNSRKNVQYHYDLGNDFYQQFLDPTMTYSCGYQVQETDSLEQMQRQKYELICRKLDLQPGESLIDIGCGWGGMLIYAAEQYGISGT
jgi:cyclopropane-fatty-acyl-phospholipid synthase